MLLIEHAALKIVTKSGDSHEVSESEIVSNSLTTTCSCSSSGGIPAGSCNAGTMSVSFRAPSGLKYADLFGAKVYLFVWHDPQGKTQVGVYNVTSSTKTGNVYHISASDNVVLLDDSCYSAMDTQNAQNGLLSILGTSWQDPATILSLICDAYDVPHLSREENMEYVPDSGQSALAASVADECSTESIKDFARYIAEYLGAFIVADENGRIGFRRLGNRNPDIEINSSNIGAGTYQKSPFYVVPVIWKVNFDSGYSNWWYRTTDVPNDAAPLSIELTNNPFWQAQEDRVPVDIYGGKTSAMIKYMWDYIASAAYDENGNGRIHPFSATVHAPYLFRIGDLITVRDPETGQAFQTYITDVTWTFRGGQAISCAGSDTRTLSVSKSRSTSKKATDYSKYLYRKTLKTGGSDTTYSLSKSGNVIILKGSDGTQSSITDDNTVYIHPAHTSYSSGFYKITVDALGHVTNAEPVVKSDITALGIPGKDTVYTGGNSDYGDIYIDDNFVISIANAVGMRTNSNPTSEIFNDYANNTAAGMYSRAFGTGCHTSGNWASSGGALSYALGDGSFAYGYGIKTSGYCQTAFGQYNENGNYIFEIGNGASDTKRSNAFAVDAKGNVFAQGDVTAVNFVGANATQTEQGLMSASDKTKLDGIFIKPQVTSVSHTDHPDDNNYLPTMNFLSWWNGAYDSAGRSNLQYCKIGKFGSIVTKNADDYLPMSKVLKGSSGRDSWETVPQIGSDGVMEVGKYIDFHINDGSTVDYDVRITADANGISVAKRGSSTAIVNAIATYAKQLQTARTINGVSFDGSANINVPIMRSHVDNESSTWNDTPWHKIASASWSSAHTDCNLVLLISRGWVNSGTGILKLGVRSGSDKIFESGYLTWIVADGTIKKENFVAVYTNDATNGKITVELWMKVRGRYDGYDIVKLADHYRSTSSDVWTLYSSNSGSASYTSGTGTITSVMSEIQNPITDMTDSGWIALNPNTSTGNVSENNTAVKYRKIGKLVEISGYFAKSTVGGSGTIGTIPTGYRPSSKRQFAAVNGSGNAYMISLNTDGVLSCGSNSASFFGANVQHPFCISYFVD